MRNVLFRQRKKRKISQSGNCSNSLKSSEDHEIASTAAVAIAYDEENKSFVLYGKGPSICIPLKDITVLHIEKRKIDKGRLFDRKEDCIVIGYKGDYSEVFKCINSIRNAEKVLQTMQHIVVREK